ncbi:ATP-grasp domain-containing protein [Nocardia transvalensis]|uniref:ATP-grasp domain-containing protein n=1 Tax=Nocardia transvalensis TaxID=37333 RepID=UPI0018933046|nr:ATP-grasp domain-containing protein [Nocardia transvalensis]MBF6328282.1 ATP-grasp domain-containing protein [Nocardia transvalensis]
MHIVVVNRWPRYFDGNRWDNELTRYEEFIDHDANRVSYVVDGPGAEGVLADPAKIACRVRVEDVNDPVELEAAVREIVARAGPVDELIALSEFTLEIAARVREAVGIPGPTVAEVAVYRDKVRMKQLLAEAGVRVPRFAACTGAEQVRAFAASCGYPLILKPVGSAASIGVLKVHTAAELEAALAEVDLNGYEIEEFVAGDIYHIDGFVDDDSHVVFQAVSRYINDCLSFAHGTPLGSVLLGRSPLRTRLEEFSREVVATLRLRRLPFHLEVFVTPGGETVFLEIGGRVGGADVPHLLNKAFGVNLYELWLRALSGGPVAVPTKTVDTSGGWLIMPKSAEHAERVVRVTSMREQVPIVWRELLPAPGEVLPPGVIYDALHHGRFILLHDDEHVVEAGIRKIMENFECEAEAL